MFINYFNDVCIKFDTVIRGPIIILTHTIIYALNGSQYNTPFRVSVAVAIYAYICLQLVCFQQQRHPQNISLTLYNKMQLSKNMTVGGHLFWYHRALTIATCRGTMLAHKRYKLLFQDNVNNKQRNNGTTEQGANIVSHVSS